VHVNSVKAPVSITANHGDIELSAISGPVSAHINNGGSSFAAHSITGPVALTGRGRDITVSDINGPVALTGEFFGDTHLERIRNTVKFHTSRTDFQLARLDGEVEISPNSDLSANQALGPVTLTTRSRNISLEHIAGDLSVSNSNGSVDLIAAPPLGNVTVENRNGSVNITVPDQAGFTVQAQTRNGDIENDFSLPTQEENNRKNFGGTVGKGGSLIRINTSEGDIALRKASLTPLPPLPPPPPPISISSPDGSSVVVTKDGSRIVSSPSGNSVYTGKDGTHLIANPDGTTVYTGKDGTHYTSSPDGTKIYAGSDGVRITATSDGRIIAIGPGGKVLSDSQARDQLKKAEDLVRKATDEQHREKTKSTKE
jgi:Putative adhesin